MAQTLHVVCKACGHKFATEYKVDPSKFGQVPLFNNHIDCPKCRNTGLYTKEDYLTS